MHCQEKKKREERRRQESRPEVSVSEEDEDIPKEFYDIKWPHPRLLKNRPTGPDEALVWFMESEKELIDKLVGRTVSNRNRWEYIYRNIIFRSLFVSGLSM